MPGLQYALSAFPRAGARNSRDAEVSSKVGSLCRWRDNRKTHPTFLSCRLVNSLNRASLNLANPAPRIEARLHTCVRLRPSSCRFFYNERTNWRRLLGDPGTAFRQSEDLAVFTRSSAHTVYEERSFLTLQSFSNQKIKMIRKTKTKFLLFRVTA